MVELHDAGESRHFSFVAGFAPLGRAMPDSRRALLVLLASTLAVVGCTTWIEQRVAPAGEEHVSTPLPSPAPEPVPALPQASLPMPVAGASVESLRDSFLDGRGGRKHQAIDIMAPRGTPVVAVADGEVAKVYRHALGGLSVYQYDGERRFAYYYAHLDRFAPGLAAGRPLRQGDLIGYVGSTGNVTGSPHLHFAAYRLGAERQWWRGKPVNPYTLLTPPAPASPR